MEKTMPSTVMNKKTIEDIDLAGKRVIVRVDFNVPQDENLNITEDGRIRAAMPTIQYLLKKNCSVILMSHLGRPKGEVNEKYGLASVAKRLGELVKAPVIKADDCIGPDVEKQAKALKPGQILLLENLRFHAEEEANDPEFSGKLAGLADIYVNDAFGSAHRAHASTEGITKHLPAVSGFLMAKEIEFLTALMANPEKPFVAILGGAKVSDKIKVIDNLLNKVDVLLIGGAMAYTFLKAEGAAVGKSLVEGVIEDKKGRKIDCGELAKNALAKAQKNKVKLLLPVDHIQSKSRKEIDPKKGKEKLVWFDASPSAVEKIGDEFAGVDIGPKTRALYAAEILKAKTVVWNGPMGVFEVKGFDEGTLEIARACGDCTSKGGLTVVGGGDSVAAVQKLGFSDKVSHISTGGGASLELLEGKTLPGVAALNGK